MFISAYLQQITLRKSQRQYWLALLQPVLGFILLISLITTPVVAQLLPPASSAPQNPPLSTQQPTTQQAQQDPKAALLAQLDAYIEPDPISIWPLAWGWWLLIAFIIIVPTTTLLWVHKKRAQQHYRNIALRQLSHINAQPNDTAQKQQAKLAALTLLTKQVYAYAYPQHKTALTFTGKTWWCFLYSLTPSTKLTASDLEGIPFESLYAPNIALSITDFDKLSGFTGFWIQRHTPPRNSTHKTHVNNLNTLIKMSAKGANHV